MAADKSFTIASQNTESEKRSVSLTLSESGEIQIYTSDDGQTALRTFGREDYEYWTTVIPENVSLLAFALLRDRFSGRVDATDELAAFCKANGVACVWGSYP